MSDDSVDTSAVLAKADALIRRRRVFVAGKPASVPAADDSGDIEIPVLTEIVELEPEAEPPPTEIPPELIEQQNAYVLAAIESWLDKQLPQAVTSVLDRLSLRLIDDLERQIRDDLLPGLLEDSRQKLLFPLEPGEPRTSKERNSKD